MNDLERYFRDNSGRLIHKWQHYFEVYDRHFARFRGSDVNLLEIGVYQGGSLQMWKWYFGARARIWGVDINPACSALAEERVQVRIGDQTDRAFLRSLAAEIGRIDIVIDDGGHMMDQLVVSFEELYPRVDAHGVYLAEDLHTCYWKRYGGGLRRSGTFIEHAKRLVDQLHAWHSQQAGFAVDDFTRSTHSLHFYDGILVVEKAPREPPTHAQTGTAQLPVYVPPAERQRWRTRLRQRLRSLRP
jgi:hypothetical protein